MAHESAPELVLSRERLRVDSVARHPAERVRLRRQVVTEVRTVEVTVRREELVVEREPLSGAPLDDDAEHTHEPLVLILSQEVPHVQLRVEPYERVTVTVHEVAREQVLTAPVRAEQVEVEMVDTVAAGSAG